MGFKAYASTTSSLLSILLASSSRSFIFFTSGETYPTSSNGGFISNETIQRYKIKFEPRLKTIFSLTCKSVVAAKRSSILCKVHSPSPGSEEPGLEEETGITGLTHIGNYAKQKYLVSM